MGFGLEGYYGVAVRFGFFLRASEGMATRNMSRRIGIRRLIDMFKSFDVTKLTKKREERLKNAVEGAVKTPLKWLHATNTPKF